MSKKIVVSLSISLLLAFPHPALAVKPVKLYGKKNPTFEQKKDSDTVVEYDAHEGTEQSKVEQKQEESKPEQKETITIATLSEPFKESKEEIKPEQKETITIATPTEQFKESKEEKTYIIPTNAELIMGEPKIATPEITKHVAPKIDLPGHVPVVSNQQGLLAKTWSALTETRPQKTIRVLKNDVITTDNEDQTVNTITWGISDIVDQMNKAEKNSTLDSIVSTQEALKNTEFSFAELQEIIALCMQPKVKIGEIEYRRLQLRENQISNLLILLERWDQIEFKRVALVLTEALKRFDERAQVENQLYELSFSKSNHTKPDNSNRKDFDAIVKTIISRQNTK